MLLSLGRLDRLDRERVPRLVVALSRYLDTGALPEGGRVGQVRDFGLVYLADALWDRLGLRSFLTRELRRRRYEAPIERALFALVTHRIVDPASKLAGSEWLDSDAWFPAPERVQLQHRYRAMDFLDDCHESLEAGALRPSLHALRSRRARLLRHDEHLALTVVPMLERLKAMGLRNVV